MNLFIAFITGLTTGGLGCLAVQSGLLASTLAYQVEQDMQNHSANAAKKFKPHIAQPIFLFLLAKLIAYTLLGFLLGSIGSVLQLTPLVQAIVYLAVGIFMLGNGLRMLNVHPIFRYFVIEPPKFLTRFIRRRSKKGETLVTPLFMGSLTIFLPCGVTQAMMAAALATSSPMDGAGLMFAFILGTTPLFFSVSYFATRLGAVVEKYFTRIVAATMLILGLVSIDSGLNLSGSPFSFSGVFANLTNTQNGITNTIQDEYSVEVTEYGYSPVVLHMPADRPVNLVWVTQNTQTCARSVVIPGLDYHQILPPTGRIELKIPAQAKGTTLRYACSMGMYPSQLVFDLE
jgi:sulfite exporter TauE/SafE